jgi:hypothetical protein
MPEIVEYRPPFEISSTTRCDAAEDFMRKCGLDPTPDAVYQLAFAFLPCLQIMCERGYDPEGTTWRDKGWKGLVHDILNKSGRLRFHSWKHNRFDLDSARDLMNFCGFYVRLHNKGKKWGKWGKPG